MPSETGRDGQHGALPTGGARVQETRHPPGLQGERNHGRTRAGETRSSPALGRRPAGPRRPSAEPPCQRIIDAIASGVVVHDRTGTIVEANPTAVALLGLSLDQPAARSMERMIDDLLDVSRIEARRLVLAKRRIDLPALVRDVVSRLQPITAGRQVQIEVVGTLPPFEADPVRIEQVLTNLLSNAVKYGDPGSEITIRVEQRDGGEVVAVTNVGPGISSAQIPTLFNRFSRTRTARVGHEEGLGLGPYISHGIVEAHGGRIWVTSTLGQTTTFSFWLPLPARAPS